MAKNTMKMPMKKMGKTAATKDDGNSMDGAMPFKKGGRVKKKKGGKAC